MNRTRERFNARARQSTAGSHKKKLKKTRNDAGENAVQQPDPNAEIIVLKSEEEKGIEREKKLRQELIAESNSKVNTKKRKRLEKYIEKKFKAEERVVLFEKLSKSQTEVPTVLSLRSSSTLGTGFARTHKEQQEHHEDKEVKHFLSGRTSNQKHKRKRAQQDVSTGLTDESDDNEGSETFAGASPRADGSSRLDPVILVDTGFSTALASGPSVTHISGVGSGLLRNSDGTVVAPRISTRKSKQGKTAFSTWVRGTSKKETQQEEESDTSFDSSDSAYDSEEGSDLEGGSDRLSGSEPGEVVSEGEDDASDEGNTEDAPPPKRKRTGFKQWALQQLSAAKSYVAPIANPEAAQPVEQDLPASPLHRHKSEPSGNAREMRGPLGVDLIFPQTSLAQQLKESAKSGRGKASPKKVVVVARSPDIEEARLQLPIVAEEQPIMEAILLHSVVVICGETGSGKTTQVPQFLYEAGFGLPEGENPGMIGITQPRRVAAVSMAARVASELSLSSSKVSYQIRYDATVSSDTTIKFMTDGVLLRELATDFLLSKYSAIIIDEAHERSMNTDILIGVLSRVIKLREEMWLEKKGNVKPLRLIIMSATLRVADFAGNTTLFPESPPVINIPARQHPVTIHFSRSTRSDYVTEAVRKTCKIHTRLPPGGVLVFLTGQNEIVGACRKLEAKYSAKALEERKKRRGYTMHQKLPTQAPESVLPINADLEAEDIDLGISNEVDIAPDVDTGLADEADGEDALDSDEGDPIDNELGIDAEESEVPMHVVPLYALLPSDKQMRVFQPPPPGHRLVVVATNVAETSLTIPGIRYVVDCGRAKERHYDVASGIQSFQVNWVSKASAAQRAGRAGRTGPGHCYRLYSSALYENYFDQFSQPEVVRMPIEGVVLQMKSMHIDSVINFPFPTSPDRANLRKAETVLTNLGALTTISGTIGTGQITEVGKAMSLFPLSPRYARMLVSGRQHDCLPYIITIVAALSVGDPFVREEGIDVAGLEDAEEDPSHLVSGSDKEKEARRARRKAFFQTQQLHGSLGNRSSDVFRILSVVGAYEYAHGGLKFCEEHFVRLQAMEEIHKLRSQISHIAQSNFLDVDIGFVANLEPPNALQLKVLRQLLTAGFIDQVAVRKDRVSEDATGQRYTTAKGVPYQAVGVAEDVFIHPSSILFNGVPPEFVIFTEIVRTSRVWMKGVTIVNGAWLPSLGKALCTYSKPTRNKQGQLMVIPRFGPAGWELPPIKDPTQSQS